MDAPTVKPARVSGVKDLLPAEAILQRDLFAKVAAVYESFGFVPIDTPCLERWSVLTGDEPDFDKSIFRTKVVRGAEDRALTDAELSGDDTALRFDLTVPLARVVSAYPELPRPFKRYQTGKVFRGEPPQAGRYREFTQFDFDIIGSSSVLADVEVIQVMYAVLTTLEFERFTIRFNSRRVLNGFAAVIGCENKANEFFRILDKVDKIGPDKVCEKLAREPDNEYDEGALALKGPQLAQVLEFLKQSTGSTDETFDYLSDLRERMPGNRNLELGVSELQTIVECLRLLEIPESFWAADLSVARGLGYYNGPVFEAHLDDMPKLGSVFGGGRFDGLTNRFIPNSNISGTGASLGIERIITGLQKLQMVELNSTVAHVLVTVFSAELETASLVLSQQLRSMGLNTELYMGEDSSLKGQFAYARKSGVPFVVFLGPDEVTNQTVQLKDMRSRQQETLTALACGEKIRQNL